MSKKTMKQRIAVVAVSALTAGLFSVVSTPVANAAVTFVTQTTNAIAPVVTLGLTKSVGVLAIDNTTALAGTGVMLSTGAFALTATADGAGFQAFKITGGVIVDAAAETTATSFTLNASSNYIFGGTTDKDLAVIIKPTVAVGQTMLVQAYTNAAASTVSGTLLAQWTITIASASVSGVYSTGTVAFTAADGNAATADVAGASETTAGLGLFLNVQLKDAYGAALTSTSGALIATVSTGATIAFSTDANAVTTAGTGGTAVSSAAPGDLNILVKEVTAGAGWAGTITVTYNNVVVATKTGKITGAPNKITIAPLLIGKNDGTPTAATLSYQVQDAAGNNVVLAFTSLVFSSSSNAAVVSTAAGSVENTAIAVGKATFTCVVSALGTSNIVLQTTLSNGSVVKSNSVAARCGGSGATGSYTASWDKAVYLQGDIAKLTISFKDATGAPANSEDAVGASTNQVITANQMERVTAHAVTPTPDINGQLVYTFTVGTSSGAIAGKYNALISFPTVTTGTTQTVGYEIGGSAGVSNADVLKSIVALIASINKQIQALQKLILKR